VTGAAFAGKCDEMKRDLSWDVEMLRGLPRLKVGDDSRQRETVQDGKRPQALQLILYSIRSGI